MNRLLYLVILMLSGCTSMQCALMSEHEFKITFIDSLNSPIVGVESLCSGIDLGKTRAEQLNASSIKSNLNGELTMSYEKMGATSSYKFFGPFKWNKKYRTMKVYCAFKLNNKEIYNSDLSELYEPKTIVIQ